MHPIYIYHVSAETLTTGRMIMPPGAKSPPAEVSTQW